MNKFRRLCFRIALQDRTRTGDKRGGMWILKGEAYGVAACERIGAGGAWYVGL